MLSNVELFGEGFDIPSMEAAILLRPTASLGLYLQQIGRALRPSQGKAFAVILDHVGNCQRHGLPDDERQWSLAGQDNRRDRSSDSASIKICPKCFAAQFPGSTSCKWCHYIFEVEARKVEEVEGTLEEIDPVAIRRIRLKEQGTVQDMESLVQLGIRRGYRRPRLWAQHVFQARQREKLMRGRV